MFWILWKGFREKDWRWNKERKGNVEEETGTSKLNYSKKSC
jgi:hypothetical protein